MNRNWFGLLPLLSAVSLTVIVTVASGADPEVVIQVRSRPVGTLSDGTVVDQYTVTNAQHAEIRVLTYGATLTGVMLPDRAGDSRNVTLYLDTMEEYLQGHPLFGSVVGRYANRIAGAAFEIDSHRYELTKNLGAHHIHGGNEGFHEIVWQAKPVQFGDRAGVELTHTTPDGHEGYPGNVEVKLQYLLTTDNSLVMEYWAKTDKPTHLNLTNHAYWNLAGAGTGNVLDHVLEINADKCVVADAQRFPTGKLRPVEGTALDFRKASRVGARINQLPDQNYDDCYVLNKTRDNELSLAARVVDPVSGRAMEVFTTQPGVQLYTAKGLSDRMRAADGPYGPYHGLCLETQHFPDSPNQPQFPSTLLRPGEEYHERTVHKFFLVTD
ncbi:MAG: aldose epimerase family protein [Pirellulaceae bacterium]